MAVKLRVMIDGIDYAQYIEELKPSINGLNADGSGRDVQTGLMVRTKIADKWKFEVKMLRIYDVLKDELQKALLKTSYSVTIQWPGVPNFTGTFYTDTIPLGSQRWDDNRQECYYDGIAFSMTEY